MKKFKKILNSMFLKYGSVLACLAFVVVTVSSNSSCCFPFYEPEAPSGIERFKKVK